MRVSGSDKKRPCPRFCFQTRRLYAMKGAHAYTTDCLLKVLYREARLFVRSPFRRHDIRGLRIRFFG